MSIKQQNEIEKAKNTNLLVDVCGCGGSDSNSNLSTFLYGKDENYEFMVKMTT